MNVRKKCIDFGKKGKFHLCYLLYNLELLYSHLYKYCIIIIHVYTCVSLYAYSVCLCPDMLKYA